MAKVGSALIQRADFEPELEQRARTLPPHLSDAETRKIVLDEMVRFEALYEKAKKAGIDQDPDIRDQIRQLVVRKYETQLRAELPSPEITDKEIADYYEANPARFTEKEQRQGSVIFLKLPSTASDACKKEIRLKAESIHREASDSNASMPGFGLLAQKHSEDRATRYSHGDMGRLELDGRYNRWERPVIAALFALKKPGEIAPIVETPKGLYLVRLTDIQASRVKPLASVKGEIHRELTRVHDTRLENEFQIAARAGVDIRIHHESLAAIPVKRETLTAAKPPSMPAR